MSRQDKALWIDQKIQLLGEGKVQTHLKSFVVALFKP